ncbi:MAG TPA: 3-hydroxyacyl-CoA dehydrogenase family protein [Dehalococcoidia bacterium]|nr:3-hydroxyacyl-CoA dehydrogenase family protein [Dehalococcoidia bacterium]
MKIENVQTVGVIGGGVMGSGITQVIVTAGYRVICCDLTDEILAKTRSAIINGRYGLKTGVERGKITAGQMDNALANLVLSTKLEDLKDCEIIIESIGGGAVEVLEDRDAKLKLFTTLDSIVKGDSIFTSNTSFLTIATLAEAVKRKGNFLGMHWFRPPVVLPVVELTYTPDTSEETLRLMEAFCKSIGKEGVRVKDVPGDPGFIGNRLYHVAAAEARKMVEQGIASQEDIDKVMELGYGWKMGIFGMSAAFSSTRQEFQEKK